MVPKNNENLAKAVRFLRTNLSDTTWQPGCRLPPIKKLAQQLHIGIEVMADAIHVIETEKLICVINRKGIFAGSLADQPQFTPQSSADTKWQKIRAQIAHDVLHNLFPSADRLPTRNQLKQRYGIGNTTLQKALEALVADGHIRPHNRGYLCNTSRSIPVHSSIVFITRGYGTNQILTFNDRIREAITALEVELTKHRIHLIKIGIPWEDATPEQVKKAVTAELAKISSGVLGIIMWPPTPGEQLWAAIAGFHAAEHHKTPIALIDESGDLRIPDYIATNRTIKTFAIAGASAGKRVASNLLQHGHRHIAYVTMHSTQSWSKNRHAGLTSAFEKAGLKNQVEFFSEKELVVSQKSGNSKAEDILIDIIKLNRKMPYAAWLLESTSDIPATLNQQGVYNECKPLFEKAVLDKSITAWVTANAPVALCAYYFLISTFDATTLPPIAIVCFDDDRMIPQCNISNYYFSFSSIMSKAVSYILNPRHEYYWNKDRIECEGVFIERGELTVGQTSHWIFRRPQ